MDTDKLDGLVVSEDKARAALIDASVPPPPWKQCCGKDTRCVFVFDDPQFESRYQRYVAGARRYFVSGGSIAVAVYAATNIGLTAEAM